MWQECRWDTKPEAMAKSQFGPIPISTAKLKKRKPKTLGNQTKEEAFGAQGKKYYITTQS